MLDSLVRVSRRVAYDHYASVRAEARSSVRAGRMAPLAIRRPERRYIPGAFDRPPKPTLARPRGSTPARRPAEPRERSCIPKQLDSSKELHTGAGTPSHTGFSPSMTARSRALRWGPLPKHPLQITMRTPKEPAFKFELLPLHSPLLGQSRLVSFPPLIDMLKFSGYPYLIRGQPEKID
ncbi:hypothetical protein N7509_000485 [Penicillium cosmopolitanum]|uniref:Uncharacterized protein n=1 Tax=Penicillium cosmopolitanum TaxID=1131564 RepID=A0A9W9WAP6_9EURO|nr:hypothetical protein N7509_000472 [Penicillium cosmopolitanum]KAJ5413849.1 hypothetical protein N7509_000476 [Penicillium cosmopolitanum]KAJ5413854.1 hypothetical protein N7509_000481 [Penicillium cosmopolitanum]KAJ5413858.1 hypothetical protein N7509_000485 [Penicillium cosmopolitanum]